MGRGSVVGRKFLAPRYYGQRAVFASHRALFHSNFTCIKLAYSLHTIHRVLKTSNTHKNNIITLSAYKTNVLLHIIQQYLNNDTLSFFNWL